MLGIVYGPVDEAAILFGARVTELEDIRPGASFRGYHCETGPGWEYRITGEPKRDKDGRLWVKAEMRLPPDTEWAKTEIDLARFGLDPSREESWNEKEWLVGSHICV